MNLLRGKSSERGNVVSESERQCGVRVMGEWGSELVRLSVMGERVRIDKNFIFVCTWCVYVFIKFSLAELESRRLKFNANFN